jgi:hypothetical protein
MDAMMSFKRLSGLTENPSVVLAALSKSPNGLLQASIAHYFDYINYDIIFSPRCCCRLKIGAWAKVVSGDVLTRLRQSSTRRGEFPCRQDYYYFLFPYFFLWRGVPGLQVCEQVICHWASWIFCFLQLFIICSFLDDDGEESSLSSCHLTPHV